MRPEFVFRKPAMKNMSEWMATEADNSERRDFKKVHQLLAIETAPGPDLTQPVEYVAVETVQPETDDMALEELNKGLAEITTQSWKQNLRTTYQDQFKNYGAQLMQIDNNAERTKEKVYQLLGKIVKDEAIDYLSTRIVELPTSDADLVWDTLHKLAANEETLLEPKQSHSSAAHQWNPFYRKEARRTDYPNLSTALPLEHTYYPPGMQPPPPVEAKKKLPPSLNDPRTLAMLTHNTLTAASATAHHPNDSPPPTPDSEKRDQYYGNHKYAYGADGGPHTTYTNQARNPYWEAGRPDPPNPPLRYTLEHQAVGDVQPEDKVSSFKPENKPPVKSLVRRALVESNIPCLDYGMSIPVTSYKGAYIDFTSKHNPNSKGPAGLSAHAMPTQCVTGMVAAGNALKESSPSHIEFLRRLAMSRGAERPKSAAARTKTGKTARSRPQSAAADRRQIPMIKRTHL